MSIWPSHLISGSIADRTEHRVPGRSCSHHVPSSAAHNSQKAEHNPNVHQVNKQMGHSHTMGYSVSERKKLTNALTYDLWRHFPKWNKPVTKRQILYDSINGKVNAWKQKVGQGLLWGERRIRLLSVRRVSAWQGEQVLESRCATMSSANSNELCT